MKNSTARFAYLLARLPIGFSMLGHGLVRITKLEEFASGMAQSFSKTVLPQELIFAFGLCLPVVELLLGIFLLLGFLMKNTAAIGVGLICVLIFGSSLQENWSAIATQMFYGLYFAGLYIFAEDFNAYSVWRAEKTKEPD